jgi:hypothetical protein
LIETKADRIEHKLDRLVEGQTAVRERVARLEGPMPPESSPRRGTTLQDRRARSSRYQALDLRVRMSSD